jgi:hypothetical protein
MRAATSSACSNDSRPREVPGTKGIPAFSMAWRARVFDPIASIAAAVGPMNFTPASTQALANFAFSERNP